MKELRVINYGFMRYKFLLGLLLILNFLISCENKTTFLDKDIFFGLSIGMNSEKADSIIKQMIVSKEVLNYGSYISQRRENDKGEVIINLFKPTFKDGKIKDLTYWIQVSTTDKDFSDKFHKGILDQLKASYGNADKVEFEGDKSLLKWNLKKLFKIELIIETKNDEGVEMYSLKYFE